MKKIMEYFLIIVVSLVVTRMIVSIYHNFTKESPKLSVGYFEIHNVEMCTDGESFSNTPVSGSMGIVVDSNDNLIKKVIIEIPEFEMSSRFNMVDHNNDTLSASILEFEKVMKNAGVSYELDKLLMAIGNKSNIRIFGFYGEDMMLMWMSEAPDGYVVLHYVK